MSDKPEYVQAFERDQDSDDPWWRDNWQTESVVSVASYYRSEIDRMEGRVRELEEALQKVPNAASYVLGTIGHGGAVKIDGDSGFDWAIHGGRRGSAIRFMEQIEDAARRALHESEEGRDG